MKKYLFCLVAVSAFLITACDNDDKDVIVPVAGVSLEQAGITVAPGVKMILKATVEPKNATNKKVTWSSNSPSVEINPATGELTTVSAGTATITVTTEEGNFSKSRDIIVKNVPVTGIVLVDKELVLAPGMKRTLVANVLSAAATNKKVIWSSDNEPVATINPATGELNVRAVGDATITATTDEGGFFDKCKIKAEFVNLLVNPGFEEEGSAFAQPAGWTEIPAAWFNSYYADPGNMAQYSAGTSNRIGLFNATGGNDAFFRTGNGVFFNTGATPALKGNFAARVEGNRPGGFFQLVTVTPRAKYGFSLTVGFRQNANANMSIKNNETVKILSPNGSIPPYHEEIIKPNIVVINSNTSESITYVVGEVTIPAGVTQIRFQFDQRTYSNPNQSPLMLVDNCVFIQLTLPPEE